MMYKIMWQCWPLLGVGMVDMFRTALSEVDRLEWVGSDYCLHLCQSFQSAMWDNPHPTSHPPPPKFWALPSKKSVGEATGLTSNIHLAVQRDSPLSGVLLSYLFVPDRVTWPFWTRAYKGHHSRGGWMVVPTDWDSQALRPQLFPNREWSGCRGEGQRWLLRWLCPTVPCPTGKCNTKHILFSVFQISHFWTPPFSKVSCKPALHKPLLSPHIHRAPSPCSLQRFCGISQSKCTIYKCTFHASRHENNKKI